MTRRASPQEEREVAAPLRAELRGPRDSVPLGRTLELDLATPAPAGSELRLAGRFALDPALVVVDRRVVAATEASREARLTLVVRACGPGRFDVGPFTLALRAEEGGEQPLDSTALSLVVAPPWPEDAPPPPFERWWHAEEHAAPAGDAPTSPHVAWWGVGALLLLLGATLATWAAARRRIAATARSAAPRRDRALLSRPLPDSLAARRRFAFELHDWLRAELAERSPATAFAWVRDELLALDAATPREAWRLLLVELDAARFSADGARALDPAIGARVAALLPELPP